jgi:hypothetical protein
MVQLWCRRLGGLRQQAGRLHHKHERARLVFIHILKNHTDTARYGQRLLCGLGDPFVEARQVRWRAKVHRDGLHRLLRLERRQRKSLIKSVQSLLGAVLDEFDIRVQILERFPAVPAN